MNVNKEEIRSKAILVGIVMDGSTVEAEEKSLYELGQLLDTAGGEVFCTVLQNKSTPDPRTLIGSGKVQEIAELKMPDLNAASLEAAMSMIAGTARSMGVEVVD